eukprot:TRINITY_DN91288_c0_g1_i1.p1 TRINITY_DN91288_c0_g1~~TRINITY_DN91288_c0_g1_i1.p1  ORF type:complete len:372 (-),score=74.31 TRINITY_DN91288_c0_g1_i1:53-1126(-)
MMQPWTACHHLALRTCCPGFGSHSWVADVAAHPLPGSRRSAANTSCKQAFIGAMAGLVLGAGRRLGGQAVSGDFEFEESQLDKGRASLQQALTSSSSPGHIYAIRSFGRASAFRRMTCGLLEKLLPGLDHCLLMLSECDPECQMYVENAGPWADRIVWGVKGAERQIAFLDQIAPLGCRLMIFDDNILKFIDRGETFNGDLDALTASGFEHMVKAGSKIWSVSDSPNPAHWSEDVDVGMGLVYGAAFGMEAMHEPSRYSRFGQVMDDVERSCRYYEHDGVTVRMGRFQVYKRHAPGMFHRRKGGISASLTAEAYAKEADAARLALLTRFPDLLETADTKLGIKFRHGSKQRSSAFLL